MTIPPSTLFLDSGSHHYAESKKRHKEKKGLIVELN